MTLRPRDRLAVGVICVLALLAGFYMLVLKPEQQKVATLGASIATEQQSLTQAKSSYTAGRAAQAALKADAGQWKALAIAVPAQSDIPALLRTLQKTAATTKVSMKSITLTGASATSSTATPSAGASGATPVPIQLTFSGGYAALNSLVKQLDGLVVVSHGTVKATGPLLSISQVTLNGSPRLTGQLTATIYQLSAPSSTTGGQS